MPHQLQMALFDLYHKLSQYCQGIDPAGIYPDQATCLDHCGHYVSWGKPIQNEIEQTTLRSS